MGLFNKLLFWRRRDDLDFEGLAEKEVKEGKPFPNEPGLGSKWGMEEKSPFPDDAAELGLPSRMPMASPINKDLELINSKLDAIKAMLASLEQRLANVEQASSAEKKQRLW